MTFPEAIGDANLLPLLETHKVMVDVAPPPGHWLTYLLSERQHFQSWREITTMAAAA